MSETQPRRRTVMKQSRSSSRFVATLVLVPAVPMLLLSVASLGLFYLAPVRFGQIISQLPGESIIRTALVFAPATLFAIVVLALLYAIEQPVEARIGPQLRPVRMPIGIQLKRIGRWLLAPAALASVISLGLWALSFVSPGRFDRLLAPLPGDSYWKPLVPLTPWLFFPLTLLMAYLAFSPGSSVEELTEKSGARRKRRSLLDTAVASLLTFAFPALLASTAALIIYRLRPERVSEILERLPFDSLVRFVLLFAPPILFSVVILAVLFLIGSRRDREAAPARDEGEDVWRGMIATGVLVTGLSLSAFLGLGGLGALLYILFR